MVNFRVSEDATRGMPDGELARLRGAFQRMQQRPAKSSIPQKKATSRVASDIADSLAQARIGNAGSYPSGVRRSHFLDEAPANAFRTASTVQKPKDSVLGQSSAVGTELEEDDSNAWTDYDSSNETNESDWEDVDSSSSGEEILISKSRQRWTSRLATLSKDGEERISGVRKSASKRYAGHVQSQAPTGLVQPAHFDAGLSSSSDEIPGSNVVTPANQRHASPPVSIHYSGSQVELIGMSYGKSNHSNRRHDGEQQRVTHKMKGEGAEIVPEKQARNRAFPQRTRMQAANETYRRASERLNGREEMALHVLKRSTPQELGESEANDQRRKLARVSPRIPQRRLAAEVAKFELRRIQRASFDSGVRPPKAMRPGTTSLPPDEKIRLGTEDPFRNVPANPPPGAIQVQGPPLWLNETIGTRGRYQNARVWTHDDYPMEPTLTPRYRQYGWHIRPDSLPLRDRHETARESNSTQRPERRHQTIPINVNTISQDGTVTREVQEKSLLRRAMGDARRASRARVRNDPLPTWGAQPQVEEAHMESTSDPRPVRSGFFDNRRIF